MKNTDLYKLKISLYGTYHTIPVTLDLAEGICRLGIRTNLDQSEVNTMFSDMGIMLYKDKGCLFARYKFLEQHIMQRGSDYMMERLEVILRLLLFFVVGDVQDKSVLITVFPALQDILFKC